MEESSYQIISYPGSTLPASYKPMVYSKWLRSLRYGNDYFKLIQPETYFAAYHTFIEKVLSEPGCHVKLAVLPTDPDVVLGFSVVRCWKASGVPNIIDYVHVQKDYRRKGIASSLIPASIDTLTHLTRNGISLWTAHLPNAKFNPFQ